MLKSVRWSGRRGKWGDRPAPAGLDRRLMPRDIRELRDDPDAYAAELRRRWGGLLSYRYIGRSWSSMNVGPVDNTVTLRRDMRSPSGAILLAVLGIAAPEGGGRSDLEAVPNPVIHSCQILDPGRDVQRIEVVSEVLKHGRQMGYSRSRIVDADQPGRVLALTQGQGISLGSPPAGLEQDAGRADRRRRRSRFAAAVAGLRGSTSPGRPLGASGAVVGGGLTRCRAAPRSSVRPPRDGRLRRGGGGSGHRPCAGRLVARHVLGARARWARSAPMPSRLWGPTE